MKYFLPIITLSILWINLAFASTHSAIQQCLSEADKIESQQPWKWDASIGSMMYDKHLTMACYKKYPNSAMTADEKYSDQQSKLYDQWKARPYGCLQPIDFQWPWAYYASSNRLTKYENVCKTKDGMTDDQHETAVKEFVPYLNSPSIFFDNPALWWTFYSDILKIKTTKKWTIDQEVNGVISSLKKYKDTFIKKDVSDKVLKEFLLKKAKEIDPVKEKQKQQAKKQKDLAEKKKQEKLVQDTIAPFAQYINPQYKLYFYNSMQEHYIKELANVNDSAQTSFENLADKQSAILTTANDFADYILINWTTEPSLVVKKWMEDALRGAITEDVMKRYNIQ